VVEVLTPIGVGAIRRFFTFAPSPSDSLASLLPRTLPDIDDVALCRPPCVLAGVCGGVVIGGTTTGGPEFMAVARGTWPSVGVGLLPTALWLIEVIVAIDDCELLRVGLPGLIEKVGAGDGCDGGTRTGEAFVREGEAVAVGVGSGVPDCEVGKEIEVLTTGWVCVG
jgi:hypothetical protein